MISPKLLDVKKSSGPSLFKRNRFGISTIYTEAALSLFLHTMRFYNKQSVYTDGEDTSGNAEDQSSGVDSPPTYDEVCDNSGHSVTDCDPPSYVDYVRSQGHVVVVIDVTTTLSSLSQPTESSSSSSSSSSSAAAAAADSHQQNHVADEEEPQQTD